jgi:F-type H+-transporting ATPase subunit b
MKRIAAAVGCIVLSCMVACAGVVSAQDEPKEPAKVEAKGESAPAQEDSPKAETAAQDSAAPSTKTSSEGEHATKGDDHHAKGDDHHGKDDHDHGHGHDSHDNTHKNATPALSKVDEFRFDQAVATFVIFLLLAAILAKFAWGPIVEGLDKREAGIAKMIEDARLAQEKAEAQLRSYEAKLAAATEEARAMVAQARADAEAAKERIQNEAKELAAKERAKAIDDINAAKNAALQEIAEKSVNTAIRLASNIVKRELKPEDHDRLVSDALSQFSQLN